ncbi:hypothetical protein [Maridesulfovibrio sp.]|uniref:hypothetical protein n=1 Tax=Maridesulfovibrio sp. TaxID=2795000 RepID=UPI0029CA9149|nr:hypothetical protein [Maridesulfovibrio sp.]
MKYPCTSCEYHKGKNNPTKGITIPGVTGKCTRTDGLCEKYAKANELINSPADAEKEFAWESTLTDPSQILSFVSVQNSIEFTATTDEEIGLLQERAVAAAAMTIQLEGQNGKALPGEAFGLIACSVVGGLNAKDAAQAGYHTLVEYFGPDGVPDQLPTTWEKAWSGRKDEKQPEQTLVPEITAEREVELKQTQNTEALVAQAVEEAEEAFRDLGRIETATFFATVSDSIIAQAFERIKKSKSYRKLTYRDENGNLRQFSDLEEFCRIKLGKSYRRVHELAQNLRTLGPELYESAEKIGFRAKDYRALNALPEEEQAVVKEAIAAESKEEVLDILQDMTERHVQEREEAKKESNELKADLEARDKLLKDKSNRLEKAETELFKLKSLPPDADLELKLAREEKAVERLHKEHVAILAAIKPFMQVVSEVLGDGDISAHTKEHAVFETRQVCGAINQFLMDCSIPVDFAEMVYPEWMRGNAQADLEAGNTEEPHGSNRSW